MNLTVFQNRSELLFVTIKPFAQIRKLHVLQREELRGAADEKKQPVALYHARHLVQSPAGTGCKWEIRTNFELPVQPRYWWSNGPTKLANHATNPMTTLEVDMHEVQNEDFYHENFCWRAPVLWWVVMAREAKEKFHDNEESVRV